MRMRDDNEQDAIKRYMRERYDGFADTVEREMRQIDDIDRLWRVAEGKRPALAYFRRRKIETALRLGGFATGARILDVGCATGDYTFLLARRGFRMTGADLSPKSVDAARARAVQLGIRDIDFVRSDAENLVELREASFDGVVSFSALRYVERLPAALAAIRHVLRPGGVAALDFPNKNSPWFTLLKGRFGVEAHRFDHQYDSTELERLFRSAGFVGVRSQRILFTSYLTPARLLPLFKLIDRAGEPLPPANHFAAIVMVRGVRN